MVFLDSILTPALLPLFAWNPFWGIVIFSFVISLLITLAYKYLTNQNEMKRLKEEQKEFQKRMKELKEHPEEMMKIQKEAMSKNFEYMKHSLKATLITMLPIILVFSWMNGHLAFEPINPMETYSVTAMFKEGLTGEVELVPDEGTTLTSAAKLPMASEVRWNLKSSEGLHTLTVKSADSIQTKNVLIGTELKSEEQISLFQHSDITQIKINYNKLRPLGPGRALFGWEPGWLGLYFIFSVLFSVVQRKMLNVY